MKIAKEVIAALLDEEIVEAHRRMAVVAHDIADTLQASGINRDREFALARAAHCLTAIDSRITTLAHIADLLDGVGGEEDGDA